jgi:hypothetical protein
VSRLSEIQALVRNGLYYLTEHTDNEVICRLTQGGKVRVITVYQDEPK